MPVFMQQGTGCGEIYLERFESLGFSKVRFFRVISPVSFDRRAIIKKQGTPGDKSMLILNVLKLFSKSSNIGFL